MKKGDLIIIALIAVIAASLFFFTSLNKGDAEVKRAVIKIDGKVVDTIVLNEENIGMTKKYTSEYGYNIIEVGNGKIRSMEADCPDQIDVKQGYISLVGETVVCLPHRFLIEIESDGSDEIDIINR